MNTSYRLQDFYERAGKWSCLAQCYIGSVLDLFGAMTPELVNSVLLKAYEDKVGMDDEFFISNPVTLMRFAAEMIGKRIKVNVTKADIGSFKDLPFTGYAAVGFDHNGKRHFVLAKNQLMYYNGLADSQCVRYGKPATARIIDIKEEK